MSDREFWRKAHIDAMALYKYWMLECGNITEKEYLMASGTD